MTKKILITGKNSYIGNQLAKWLSESSEKYEIVKESVRDNKWKNLDLSVFDVVVHVAGIAHQDTKKDQEEVYYKINTDLTVDIANKAKKEGVKQFIFLSSMIVYGSSSEIGDNKVITSNTIPEPSNFYGNSKLLAEKGIQDLQSDSFKVIIIRPPMIYGKNSKGNYPILAKFARVTPVFPDVHNQKSMLHIDNLTELINLLIINCEKGIFFPQNKEYVNTSNLVKIIAKVNGKNIWLSKILASIVKVFFKKNFINKIFGSLVYEKSMSEYKKANYQIRDLEESIMLTERSD